MVFFTVILCLLMQRLLGASFLLSDKAVYFVHIKTIYRQYVSKLKWLRRARVPVLHLLLFCVPLLLLLVYVGVFLQSYFGQVAYFIWGLFCLWVCVDAYDTVWCSR